MEAWREELYHHGIEGQRWGKRNGPPYPLDYGAHSSEEKKRNSKSQLDNYKNNKPVSAQKRKEYIKKEKKSKVAAYNKTYNKAVASQEKADRDERVMKEAYQKTGKTAVTRVINNIAYTFKSESEKKKMKYAKELDAYNKTYNKAVASQEKADRDERVMKEAYQKTGKTAVTRVINNIKYS